MHITMMAIRTILAPRTRVFITHALTVDPKLTLSCTRGKVLQSCTTPANPVHALLLIIDSLGPIADISVVMSA